MGLLQTLTLGHSPLVLIAIAIAALAGWIVLRSHNYYALVHRLGGRAPLRHSTAPLGLGFIYHGITRAAKYEDYDFWVNDVLGTANPNRPHTTEIAILGKRLIFTADEENIKAILATQFQDFGKGPEFKKVWHDFLGDSIFTTDGKQWHDSRALIRPQFIKDRVSDLNIFEENIKVMVPKLSTGAGTAVNATDLFFRYTLDSATHFLLGKSTDSLITPRSRFAEAFGYVQHVQSNIARMGPLHHFMPRTKFRAELRVLDEFFAPYIEETLRMSPQEIEERGKSDKGYTFLHALAAFTRDRRMLRDQLISVLLAARDTTAVTLSWLFYSLSKHPEVLKKLRAEILETVGRDKVPTYEDLKAMRYLQYTLNEILRLYPAVPYNVRVALRDTTLPVGAGADGMQPVGIPAGTPVGYSTLVLQSRRDIYPPTSDSFPDPSVFCPDRWFHWTPKNWTYVPFNGGPRICVGQQFALTELGYTVVRILQTYARIENRMSEEPKHQAEIVLQPSVPIMLAFYKD